MSYSLQRRFAKQVDVTGTTLQITRRDHENNTMVLKRAAGTAVTLPPATGSGNHYNFIVGVTISGGSTTIKVTGDDIMQGVAFQMTDTPGTAGGFATTGTSDTITLNGSTTGGLRGDMIQLMDIAADTWQVFMAGAATGTEATPFSATVT